MPEWRPARFTEPQISPGVTDTSRLLPGSSAPRLLGRPRWTRRLLRWWWPVVAAVLQLVSRIGRRQKQQTSALLARGSRSTRQVGDETMLSRNRKQRQPSVPKTATHLVMVFGGRPFWRSRGHVPGLASIAGPSTSASFQSYFRSRGGPPPFVQLPSTVFG